MSIIMGEKVVKLSNCKINISTVYQAQDTDRQLVVFKTRVDNLNMCIFHLIQIIDQN